MVSRRAILAAAMSSPLTTLAATTSAVGAPVGGDDPRHLSRPVRETVASGRVPTDGSYRARIPMDHLSLSWAGPAGARVVFRDGSRWRAPLAVRGCGAAPDGDAHGASRRALIPAGGAEGFRLELPDGSSDVVAVASNTTAGATVGSVPLVASRTLRAGASVTGAGASVAGDRRFAGLLDTLPYRSRAAWGADESLRFDGTRERTPQEFFPVQKLTVHHTVTANDDPDPSATMRAIYFDQAVTRGFGDIGYQLLIDASGVVYEGRVSGDDGFPVFGGDLGPDRRPQMCNGAHSVQYNAGNVGVALLGDFQTTAPTDAARTSLVAVLAILAGVCGLDPLESSEFVNPITGLSKVNPNIAGHRDWNDTECPGDETYLDLPAIRDDVAALLP
jgi:hypothetical protein